MIVDLGQDWLPPPLRAPRLRVNPIPPRGRHELNS